MNFLRHFVGTLALAVFFSTSANAADPTPAELKKAIEDLQKATNDLKDFKESVARIPELRGKTIELDARLELLEKDIKEIKARLGDGKTVIALRPDTNNPTQKGFGRLRFINTITEEVSVVVNGKSYRLIPGEERLIAVTPGEYYYQVLNIQFTRQERQIAADETKTITIYPLR